MQECIFCFCMVLAHPKVQAFPRNNHFNTGFFFQLPWPGRLPSIPERYLSEPLTRSCREREALAFVLQLPRFYRQTAFMNGRSWRRAFEQDGITSRNNLIIILRAHWSNPACGAGCELPVSTPSDESLRLLLCRRNVPYEKLIHPPLPLES